MQSLTDLIYDNAVQVVSESFPELDKNFKLEITPSTQPQFGHYQLNSAMALSKLLKQNPREIANKIVSAWRSSPLFEKIEVAGPGFINLTVAPSVVSTVLNQMSQDKKLGARVLEQKKRLVIDFSSPNVAKEMHVGHLRSTIIGDALANLHEFLGYDVLRLNHIGDWGTAFGMLIAYLKINHPSVIQGQEMATLPMLMQWYKNAKKQFDEDEFFKKQSQLEVVALQGGDATALKAWQKICEISQIAYHEIYQMLGVKITDRGESFYNPQLPSIVEDLTQKGLIEVSDGAKCLFIDGFVGRDNEPLPFMIQKSDGGFNYSTTDMAAMRHRVEVEKADEIIIVTDSGQQQHFEMLKKASTMAGYLPAHVEFRHVPFGLVLGADGKKFKTRSGETEKLIDLLNNAVIEAKKRLLEREEQKSEHVASSGQNFAKEKFSEEEMNHLATILGIGAVKYADLSSNRIGDYVFSYERMLKFEGNTAAFLLYSYVRILSIKRKIEHSISVETSIHIEHPSEMELGLHLSEFPNTLSLMAKDLCPHRLCEYLYQTANKFNAFFRDCKVQGTPQQEARLALCDLTQKIFEQGLRILGLKTVERM